MSDQSLEQIQLIYFNTMRGGFLDALKPSPGLKASSMENLSFRETAPMGFNCNLAKDLITLFGFCHLTKSMRRHHPKSVRISFEF